MKQNEAKEAAHSVLSGSEPSNPSFCGGIQRTGGPPQWKDESMESRESIQLCLKDFMSLSKCLKSKVFEGDQPSQDGRHECCDLDKKGVRFGHMAVGLFGNF